MREQVDHYLKRARVAAQRDSVVYRTPVTPLLERLVRVLEKLGRMKISLTRPASEIVFAGEREDLEEIVGNLLENAMKWAKSRVAVSAQELPSAGGEAQRRFTVIIEDDGPGIPEDKAREALKRGKTARRDQARIGTGTRHRRRTGQRIWRQAVAGTLGTRRPEGFVELRSVQ